MLSPFDDTYDFDANDNYKYSYEANQHRIGELPVGTNDWFADLWDQIVRLFVTIGRFFSGESSSKGGEEWDADKGDWDEDWGDKDWDGTGGDWEDKEEGDWGDWGDWDK